MFKHSFQWKVVMVYTLVLTLILPGVFVPVNQASANGNMNLLSAVNNNLDRNLNTVIFANGKYTAVGEKGNIIQSTSGLDWTRVNTGASNAKTSWRSLVYANNMYVAVGVETNASAKARLITSSDGEHWTDRSAVIDGSILQKAVYIEGKFYVVGGKWHASDRNQDIGIIYSSSDGENWTLWSSMPKIWPSSSTTSTTFYLMDLAYISGRYVVGGNVFGGYAYSNNGISWTNGFRGSNSLSSFSIYNEKLYMIENYHDGYSSSDGITFTADPSYNDTLGTTLIGTTLYRFGKAGKLDTSADNGVSWSSQPKITNIDIKSLASNGTGIALVTSAPNSLVVTADKSTWKKTAANLQSIAYSGSSWVVAGQTVYNNTLTDSMILHSSSGWDSLHANDQLKPKDHFSKVAFGNNMFVAMGSQIGTSTDGEHWTLNDLPAGVTGKVQALTYGVTGGFLGITDTGNTLTSSDGVLWTKGSDLPASASVSNVKYVNGIYVAVGYQTLLKSNQLGNNWVSVDDPDDNIVDNYYNLNDIIYDNGSFKIVGSDENSNPIVLETVGSLDRASTWVKHAVDNTHYSDMKSIAYGTGLYVTAGVLYDASGAEHYIVYSSSDLVNWTPYDESTLGINGESLSAVYYQDGMFYITGSDNARIVFGDAAPISNITDLSSVLGMADNAPGGGDGSTTGTAISWILHVPNMSSTLGLSDLSLLDSQAKVELFSSSDYSSGSVSGNTTIPLTAGGSTTAYIKVTAADNVSTKYYAVTVNREPTPETTPNAAINYTDEQLTGLVLNASYSINGASTVADASGHITINGSWIGTTLSIIKTGNGTTTTDSSVQTLVLPSRPAIPSGVNKTDETSNGAQDGTITQVTDLMEYKKDVDVTWTAIVGTSVTGLAPATYEVRIKATSSDFASLATPVTVGSFSATPETTPNAAINYTDEQLAGLVPNASYSINGASTVADASGHLTINGSWIGTTLSIIKTGNGTTTTDSSAQTLVLPSRPAIPSGLNKTDETSNGAQDGTITQVTDLMEYKKDVDVTWTAIVGTSVTELAPAIYEVRIKATSSDFASLATPVTVGSFSATPETTPNAAINYTDEQLTGLVPNASYSINGASTVADASGHITINGSWIGTTLSIIKTGNGTTTTDSSVQTLVLPSRPAIPSGVNKTDETSNGAQDGTITQVTDLMEYKKDVDVTWTAIVGTSVTGLAPATYEVRIKATSSDFASLATPVTVGTIGSIPAAPNVTADDQNNLILGLDTTMEYQIDNGAYVLFNGANVPNLSGTHTVKVRIAANGPTPAGAEKTIQFTANPATGLNLLAQDPTGSNNNGKTLITVSPAIQNIEHHFVYRNIGSSSINIPAVGETSAGYERLPANGLVNAANGDRIIVAEVDGDGKIVKFGWTSSVVQNETAPGNNTPEIPVVTSPPSGGGTASNPSSSNSANTGNEDVIVIVNGQAENAGKSRTTDMNGIKTTLLTVDPVKLKAKLDSEGSRAIVTIPVRSAANVIIGELNGESIKNMEDSSATLVLQTEQASYTIPASQINIDAIATTLGNTLQLKDMVIRITIAESSKTINELATNAAVQGGFTIIGSPVDFTLTGSYQDQTVETQNFNVYVERKIKLSSQIDPNRITTGIVVETDGKVRHVPTKVVLEQGTYYAKINSLTNSSYGIVWNPKTFADVENHWAKAAVNDMASRMVINGINDAAFNPNEAITRAEFAAIIVRGLGLKLGKGSQPFNDVTSKDWYFSAIKTAASYELINGFADGTFRPNDTITREQAMTLIARAMKLTGLAEQYTNLESDQILSIFKDATNAGNWAKNDIALTIKAGLISGRGEDRLAAKANVTRAEVAALIQRLLLKSDLI
ncbi:S-layer homology domain-containing protein [Paenibacillus sp. RRE4]|uniref:S-layer homology domain-containing protein n=1 Tax=Paenibacillus sp. RRE4 TaxID=2962587 RepID=UPI00288196E0|nr:S-layer homology domain-containing protein [Paenibacillus sp. RRE4]MDT0124525.1 S-layer homology domain-containing protein [Paenibacillus sp. RRE4]